MPCVLVPLAPGCEELEAVTIIDLLRRAGIEVVVAGLEAGPVTGSRGTRILPDTTLDDALGREYDMVALPGGMPGSQHLADDPRIAELLKRIVNSGKFAGAVCAAPMALEKAGLLKGKRATAYPGVIDDAPGVEYTGAAVEVDGKIVTSRGPGTAMDFALTLIEQLEGREARQQVEARLVRG